ncbi:MAG: hypothetical protein K8T20_12900, partial [Planctomycetes bacterium]|nr:hypothetical protein [Planctomycetota bacterium]
DTPPRFFAGGTCGNVLAILSYLGWRALPVARLGDNGPAERVLRDLKRCGVDSEYATLEPGAATPIIVQRIRRDSSDNIYHSFSWRCPRCRSRLPGYAPVPSNALEPVIEKLPSAEVFFFDRVSRGALKLAEAAKKRDAIVFFEPSGDGEPPQLREALALAHVVKYAQERRTSLEEWFTDTSNPKQLLEIETLGRSGLRYRTRLGWERRVGWHQVPAFQVPIFRDAAGCGDWLTAGIIECLGKKGLRGLRETRHEGLTAALSFGQALAAWNCGYEGARAGMYQVTSESLRKITSDIVAGSDLGLSSAAHRLRPPREAAGEICLSCTVETRDRRAMSTTRSPG